MVYHGHIKEGVVVLDDKHALPEGTEVRIETLVSTGRKTLAERFKSVIGTASDLPEDMAENHDHYLHGAPKK